MNLAVLERLAATLASRKGQDAASSYTAALYAKGTDAILKKVGEECAEFICAAKDVDAGKATLPMVKEGADVLYHLMVALEHQGMSIADVLAELARREGTSGHSEKAARTPSPSGGFAD